MKLKPLGARTLIKPYTSAETSSSGIALANDSNTSGASVKGTVIEVGETSRFKVGDVLYWRRFSMDSLKTITPDGEIEVCVVDDEDVVLIQED